MLCKNKSKIANKFINGSVISLKFSIRNYLEIERTDLKAYSLLGTLMIINVEIEKKNCALKEL
jgi:hypothetical protein